MAIFDHDDICHHERLASQLWFMESLPYVDIVDSAITYFSEVKDLATASRVLCHPCEDAVIKTKLLRICPIGHPSAMSRRNLFTDAGGYLAEFSRAEDYALWCRAAPPGKRFANLEESLMFYRLHPARTSQVQCQRMAVKDIEIKRLCIRALLGGDDASLAELLCLGLYHKSNKSLAGALTGLIPVILKFGQRMPCPNTSADLVGQVLAQRFNDAHSSVSGGYWWVLLSLR
ncbi:hypothetical protein [Rhodoferax aquaticus]|uniref:Uncharacterized protein n=1 Tax=Rhodoferax aquaticus TaxID=2527691 RepID=A0A515EP54_9BURK|nr:hypothetical protein [Rhodoferax aquaticus]QDL54443.1 hypothetical protein EXZ61_09870 [Rhodoferax aquaticus]